MRKTSKENRGRESLKKRKSHKESSYKSSRERVLNFLGQFKRKDTLLMPIIPDPDSLASALAVKRLLWRRVSRMTIAKVREIQRLDNLAMVRLLKIPLIKAEDINPEDFTRRVLLDSQPHHHEFFNAHTYDAIIDHHPKTSSARAAFVDIRPEYGANSTILIEYLRSAGIKPSMKLATALLYAIKTDTGNFERSGGEADVRQFQYLFQFANMSLLKKIEKSEFRIKDLHYFQRALEHKIIGRKGLFVHLGRVPNPDICVQIADFFMRVHGLGWSFVSGVWEGQLIVILRNDGLHRDAGKLAIGAFGTYGSAGGHQGAARAEISLSSLRNKGINDSRTSLEKFVKQRLKL